ncbi:MAG: tetratricopeptide repeat protein [Bacteroidaceae bacterium]|nr:tetratricopeptide repeat protein [Bacteroidaceae bacterium]
MRYLSILLSAAAILVATHAIGRERDRDYVRRGNRLMADTLYSKAQVEYQKATEVNSVNPEALYNLGTALLAQGQLQEAQKQFQLAAAAQPNKLRAAQIYHNMGVILQSQKKFGEAIECYKNALRRNPLDDETRYNLALCQHQQQQQPQGGQDNNEDQQGDDKEKKDEQQQQQPQQPHPPQQQQPQMSRENAEQLLKAAMQEERQTQDKVQKAQQRPQRRQLEKQW